MSTVSKSNCLLFVYAILFARGAMSQKRKAYSIADKLKIIERVKKGETKASISRECGIPEGTIRGWVKEEHKLRHFVDAVESDVGLQRKTIKLGEDSDLDECLYRWFLIKRSEGVPLSGPILRAQAVKFHNDLYGNTDFKASDGWFSRWKARHGIHQVNIEGEARSSDNVSAAQFPAELHKVMSDENLTADQVYNCDETALYFRLLPTKSLDVQNSRNKSGFKQSKDRITLLFAVNKSGNHKLKPLCIGKSRSPRCFKHVNMKSLPVTYTHTKNAWMTGEVFSRWFNEDFVSSVRSHLRSLNLEEKAILTLDHCPVHPSTDLLQSRDGKIKVMFLPKNTTALIQPLDQGIIRAFKAHYRRELLSAIVSSDSDMETYLKSLNLKGVLYSVGLAWQSVTQETIQHCWKKCSFSVGEASLDSDEHFLGFSDNDVQSARSIVDANITLDDLVKWADCDSTDPVSETIGEQDIIAAVRDKNDGDEGECESEDDDTDVPSVNQAVHHIDQVILWLETQSEPNHVSLLHLANIRRYAEQKRIATVRQTKVSDFFKRKE